jgi:uncharacterized membrane protein YedE/YeeE
MFPIKGEIALLLAIVFGFVFGWLLQRGKVTNYNVIVNQFRFKDFTVLKVMFPAIIVGGIGVLVLTNMELAKWHVRDANMLGTIIGAAIFGIGMVLYGYCPGTGVAAIGTGSIHALVGAGGMIAGAILYAFSFEWVRANILSVGKLGKVTLPQLMHVPAWTIYGALIVIGIALFVWVEKNGK